MFQVPKHRAICSSWFLLLVIAVLLSHESAGTHLCGLFLYLRQSHVCREPGGPPEMGAVLATA